MNKQQFVDLVNTWIKIEEDINQFVTTCTDEERVFMLNKYVENSNNTNTLLVKYITQDIPIGQKVIDNLGEAVNSLVDIFWQFVRQDGDIIYVTYTPDGKENQIEVDTAETLYECIETSKLMLW